MAPSATTLASVALLCASMTVALPSLGLPNIGRDTSTSITSIPVTWYQGEATATTCGLEVSNSTLQSGTCYTLYTAALGIQQTPGLDCTFKMWSGVSDCSGDGSWTETVIPSGDAISCINDNVLDGGAHTHMSGIYSCPS